MRKRLPSMWGASPRMQWQPVDQAELTIDGGALTAFVRFDGDLGPLAWLNYDVTARPLPAPQAGRRRRHRRGGWARHPGGAGQRRRQRGRDRGQPADHGLAPGRGGAGAVAIQSGQPAPGRHPGSRRGAEPPDPLAATFRCHPNVAGRYLGRLGCGRLFADREWPVHAGSLAHLSGSIDRPGPVLRVALAFGAGGGRDHALRGTGGCRLPGTGADAAARPHRAGGQRRRRQPDHFAPADSRRLASAAPGGLSGV